MAHPDAYCMSADVAGPIRTPGRDPESRNHKPATFKYFLSVSYRFPRLKGVKEESDPAKTEGCDDPALLTPLSHGPRKGKLVPKNVRITKILCTAPVVLK